MTECGNSEVTSTLKTHFLDTHNQRRGQLASGSLTDAYGGITLPKAKDMCELIWNCDLEKQAIDYVRKCPTDTDTTLNDQSPGENFYRISSADLPYYRDGIKKAVTEWWKVYRWYNTPGTSATFLSSHANSPVSSYTR
ncbi:SCP-like protein, partial [Oesophagostomum dentatum]